MLKMHITQEKIRHVLNFDYIHIGWKIEANGIKIWDPPSDTVAQLVECLRDKQRLWVQILASVRFLDCYVTFLPLCYPGEALEGPSLTAVCIIIMLTQKKKKIP